MKRRSSNRMVVNAPRVNAELNKTYEPRQVKLGAFQTSPSCQLVLPAPTKTKPWPSNCDEVNGAAIGAAIDGGEVGFILLNGKRLGNLSAMEAIPNQAILGFRASQIATLGQKIAGEIVWNAGSRDGVGGKVHKECRTKSPTDCYIARFGWMGDRVSLEDQVANAAFVEMNMTTKRRIQEALRQRARCCFRSGTRIPIVVRPTRRVANRAATGICPNKMSNGWPIMHAGSAIQPAPSSRSLCRRLSQARKSFDKLKCDTCHVIRKIDIVPDDTMLTKDFRDRLTTRVVADRLAPFLSYIGTDLLMHDMGYLSQVGNANEPIRDSDGVVLPKFKNYVQKIRTPALKGLRFNRFVTDSHNNTKNPRLIQPVTFCCTMGGLAMRSRRRSCTMGRRSRNWML